MRGTKIVGPIPDCAGKAFVHSVFEHSINIEIPEELCLVTVHSFAHVSLPGSFYVPDLSAREVKAGMTVSWDRNQLCIGTMVISLDPEQESDDLKLYEMSDDKTVFRTAVCRSMLEEKRMQDHKTGAGMEQVYNCLYQNLETYFQSLIHRDETEGRKALKKCIGLGFGLTPSGDDMLCGILGFQCVYDPSAFAWTSRLLQPELTRTNRISASYLGWACKGYASSLVKNVIYGLKACEIEEHRFMDENTEELLKIGHTSGADLLEGILLAAEKKKGNTGQNQML